MIEFREADASDRDAILALRSRCFPIDDPEKRDPRFWEWEFVHSPYGPARMFVAHQGAKLVAHLALVPWYGERAPLAVDAMTDPDARRQGVFRRLVAFARGRAAESYAFSRAFQIRKPVLRAMVEGGWRVEGRAWVVVRPTALPLRRKNLELRSLELREPSPFFRWRYESNPLWEYTITRDDDAWLVTRRTTLKGYDTLAIVDLHGDARELLREAVSRAKAARITLVAALITWGHPALGTLLRAGFMPGPHRFRVLVNRFEPAANVPRGLMWGDTDHL